MDKQRIDWRLGPEEARPALSDRTLIASPLEQIEQRIIQAARASQEIGHKLHQHADEVHGPMVTRAGKPEDRDQPQARLERIFMALDFLDEQQSYMAEAAGRNTTLA